MSRRLVLFAGLGVRVERAMTNSGSGCRSGEFSVLLDSEGLPSLHAPLQLLAEREGRADEQGARTGMAVRQDLEE